ncbi:ribose 5-phosphate isomerase B [Pleomorphomonas koreensis]|uniref:ribose 5-phosphate isomerase B n=1 Tax=Pleomorphomonas koreensis TaxID=257440 RepID=UPI00040F4D1A|nr:ribose 5-phosphate isomerase B [Pleomorphomonas koreensis]
MSDKTRIVITSDHTAIDLRRAVVAHLEARGCVVEDVGPVTTESTDYPKWGEKAARVVLAGGADLGIAICGTGFGISLAANKLAGIRCVVCSEPYTAKLSRQHNNANMLAFGARVVGQDLALMIVDTFLDAEFEGGRHARRVGMISELEAGRSVC